MAKWADYVIVEVSYDEDGRIANVKRCPDLGDKLGKATVTTRDEIVAGLRGGTVYITAYKNADGTWRRGEFVDIINVGGVSFIRTDGNRTKADNLAELPEF